VSDEHGLEERLRSSAQGLVREVAERLDIAGVKQALTDIETAGRRTQVAAEVTSAVPLTDAERQAIETRLRGRHGRDLPIAYRIDAAILGGLIVRVGDRYIDGSVAARLGQLRQHLTGTGG
jgi:F-type H+-transporting ATPase subunit delta